MADKVTPDVDDDAVRYTYPQAVNRLKDIADEIDRLNGKDDLTDEDRSYFEDLTDEADKVAKYASGLKRSAARIQVGRHLAALGAAGPSRHVERGDDDLDRDPMGEPDSVEDCRFKNPWDLSEIRTWNRSREQVGQEMKARAFSAIERMVGTRDAIRSNATRIIEEFDDDKGTIARMCLATSAPAYVRAFSKAARGKAHTMSVEEIAAVERAMSLTDDEGGYLVPFQLDPAVIITSDGKRNDIRRVARQVVATGDVWHGVSSGEVSWSWDGQDPATAVSDDSTTFAGPSINIYTARGFVPITINALADEANVTAQVSRLLLRGKTTLENTSFATGSGSAPQGIVTALAGTSSEINAAADDTFARGDVENLEGVLPATYRESNQCAWLANNAIYTKIRGFDQYGGGGFWVNLGGGRPAELMGYPALEAEAMDGVLNTSGAVSNFVLVFGDFDNYVIADRIGTTVEFIPHLFDPETGLPLGQRGWYAYFRAGADSVNDGAFRLLDVPSAS